MRGGCFTFFGVDLQGKELHGQLQLFSLAAHLFCCGSQLFAARSVLLGNLTQLVHGLVDLADTGGLLNRSGTDLLHQIRGLVD